MLFVFSINNVSTRAGKAGKQCFQKKAGKAGKVYGY